MVAPSEYREFAPPAHLSAHVECFWTHACRATPGRIVPDTCVDLIFSRDTGLQIVGSMTRPLFSPASRHPIFGVRLRAGTVQSVLSLPLPELCDRVVPISDLIPRPVTLPESTDERHVLAMLEQFLAPAQPLSPTQLAIAHLAANGGMVRIDEAARMCGLSVRQFRRHCIEQTGFSPKTLARISRFRRAWERSMQGTSPNWTDVALDCGYYDQAHLVNDFVEFSGVSPAAFRRSRDA